ncbi:hypothetical protein DFS34DRAFT_432797 [Phlyctochytrium arcticum]|nr:hypothetical protein DFS34DRAFT_432797 [Phlyctochytrium arcticum]
MICPLLPGSGRSALLHNNVQTCPNTVLRSVNMPTPQQAIPTGTEEDTTDSSSSSSSDSEVDAINLPPSLVYHSGRPTANHSNWVDFDKDPYVWERKARQEKIIDVLDSKHIRLVVTAPPNSGKSTMIELLMRRLVGDGKSVFVLDIAPPKFKRALSIRDVAKSEIKYYSYSRLPDELLASYDYILVDDAHEWTPTGLVMDLTKGQAKGRVVFFETLPFESFDPATPVLVGQMAWDEFKLREDEKVDYCNRVITWAKELKMNDELVSRLTDMLPVIRSDTGGHVGSLRRRTEELLKEV